MKELPVFDFEDALERVEQDREFLVELVQIFLNTLPETFDALTSAMQNDRKKVAKIAHTLKGALGNLGAVQASSTAAELERFEGEDPTFLLERLKAQIENFKQVAESSVGPF